MEEGYIKFNCNWINQQGDWEEVALNINTIREKLYKLNLIGVYPDGVGFGNISTRIKDKSFLITASSTGSIEKLNQNHYSLVTQYDIQKNSITCIGSMKASSESLTHAILYECSPHVNGIIHIHSAKLWEKLIHKVPTTSIYAEYGTPDIANEIKKVVGETKHPGKNLIVMGGHKDGILAFGKDLNEAFDTILTTISV